MPRPNTSIRVAFLPALFLLCLFSITAKADWQWVRPSPQGNILDAIVWGGVPGRFVAVGHNGTVLISDTGAADSWQLLNAGTSAWFQDLVWTGTQFLAVGTAGTVATSTDGIRWSLQNIAGGASLYAVIWTGSQFVTVGSGGTVATSPDGRQWVVQRSGTSAWLNDIDWSGKEYVAVGSGGTILRSPDAGSWSSIDSGTATSLEGVAWNGRIFAAGGEQGVLLTSTDGTTWSAQDSGTGHSLRKMRWIGGRFVAPGFNGLLLASIDGIHWQSENTTSDTLLEDLALAPNGTQVMVGKYGTLLLNARGVWTSQRTGLGAPLRGVAINGEDYVAVGAQGTILHGRTGAAPAVRQGPTGSGLNDVVWDGSRYVAVGDQGVLLASNDGQQWNSVTTGISSPLLAAAHNGTLLVVVGAAGVILSGPTAEGLTRQDSGVPTTLRDVTWSGTAFLAVGDGGLLLQSVDGSNWTRFTSGTVKVLRAVACGVGHCVAGGDAGAAVLTTDGMRWQPAAAPSSNTIYRIVWDGQAYLAATSSGAVPSGLLSSPNGALWSPVAVTGNDLYGVDADGKVAMVVGDGGAILVMDDPTGGTTPKGPHGNGGTGAETAGSHSGGGAVDPLELVMYCAFVGLWRRTAAITPWRRRGAPHAGAGRDR